MRTLIAALTLPLALAGCGDDPEPDASASPLASESVVKVSDATICGQLIDADPAPFQRAIDVMRKDTAEPGDTAEATKVADQLEEIATRAESDSLASHTQVLADELREIFGSGKTDTSAFVTSATEVNNICGVTPRF